MHPTYYNSTDIEALLITINQTAKFLQAIIEVKRQTKTQSRKCNKEKHLTVKKTESLQQQKTGAWMKIWYERELRMFVGTFPIPQVLSDLHPEKRWRNFRFKTFEGFFPKLSTSQVCTELSPCDARHWTPATKSTTDIKYAGILYQGIIKCHETSCLYPSIMSMDLWMIHCDET